MKKLKTKKRTFKVEENLRQFFPPTSPMGFPAPTHWERLTTVKKKKKASPRAISTTFY